MLRHALVLRATMAATWGSRTAQTALAHSSAPAAAARPSRSALPSTRAFSTGSADGSIVAPAVTATVAPAAAAVAAPAASSSSPSGSSAPSRRRQRAWADPSTMVLLKERGIVRTRGVRPRPEGSDPHSPIKASLQRGAPKPRPLLPVPAALRGVDKPWMQQQLTLHFEAPPTHTAHSFALNMTQWTGMEEIGWRPPQRRRPARAPVAQPTEDAVDATDADPTAAPAAATDDAVAEAAAAPEASSDPAAAAHADVNADEDAWVDAPELTPEQEAAEAEARAQADAGSGTIVWDAALHLAHWIHAEPSLRVRGPILELGAGTGALGLAVQKILAQQDGGDARAVLTDGGKVLELLQKNVEANASNAVVLPLDWSAVPSFLSQLPTSSSSSSSSSPPPFFRTLLCSELLDSIPSPANSHRAFDRKSFATLVDALTQLARHSLAVQTSMDPSAGPASVEILFTFEQRGVLSLGPDGILREHLLDPLQQAGFTVEHVEEPSGVYTQESNMTLFRMRME